MDRVTSDNARVSVASNSPNSCSADSAAQSQFAQALNQEAQSSSSAGQPLCSDPSAPTPREQAAQQSLPDMHQTGPNPSTITANRTRGLAAASALKDQVESKGQGLQSEVTVKGGRGGSRVDIAPDPAAPQTIPRTLESKNVDLNNYRTSTGELDVNKLRSAIRGDIQQIQKHQQALARGVKPDMPMRESAVYTVENAKPGEAAQVQQLFREEATPQGIKGGVLENNNGKLQTSSGRPLSGGAAEAPTGAPEAAAPAAKAPAPAAKPTPTVEPPVTTAPKAGSGPGVVEGIAGKAAGPAAVVGGTLSAKKFAEDLEMHMHPSTFGKVGDKRTDSQGTVWIKTEPDTWVTQAYNDKGA